jgi:hypothetical protein
MTAKEGAMGVVLRRGVAAVVCVAIAAAAAPARAQGMTESQAQASEHFSRGVKLYQEDDYRAALIEFTRAYELAPNWAVLYDIGQSYYQLRDYAGALRTLERYVSEGGDKMAPDRKAQVDRELTELRGRVAHVTVVANVEGVDVMLDDAPLGHASATEPYLIGAGRHRFSASHAGYVTASRVVDIAGGDVLSVRLDLAPTAPPSPTAPRESPSYAGAVVGGVVGAAGIAVGAVFGALTVSAKSKLDGECTSGKMCPSSAQGDIDTYSHDGTISGIAFGVGIVALIAGSYSFFHERAKEAPAPTARARITPWIAPGSGGISGSF